MVLKREVTNSEAHLFLQHHGQHCIVQVQQGLASAILLLLSYSNTSTSFVVAAILICKAPFLHHPHNL